MANSFPEITWLTTSGSWPSFSPDGSQIVYVDGGKLFTVPTAGGKPALLFTPPKGQQATRPDWSWSPLIAFALGSGNEQTIWLINPDGSTPSQFPNQDGLTASIYPSWNQNLQSIVVMETMNPDFARLYQIFATGSNPPVLLTPSSGFCAGRPSVNPTGTAVAFAGKQGAFDQQNNQIWIVQPPSTQPFQLDPEQGRSPNWSPDGLWILFESNRGTGVGGNYQLWVARAPVPNGPVISPQPVTPPDVFVSHGEWSRQQNLIVFDNANHGEGIGIITVPPPFQGTA